MKYVRLSGKIVFRLILGILLFITGYFLVAGISSCIPVNTDYAKPADGVTIAVTSNGVHTDILVPVKNDIRDWTKLFSYGQVKYADSTYRYLSFGWGDKGFFINTPTWADLKASTAFNAMFWLSTSAMHVTWKKTIPPQDFRCRILVISKEKYAALCNFISGSFTPGNDHLPQYIIARTYGDHDAFYEAKGRYNLFRTCNCWTGEGLKIAGVRVALWTPFSKSIFMQLPQ